MYPRAGHRRAQVYEEGGRPLEVVEDELVAEEDHGPGEGAVGDGEEEEEKVLGRGGGAYVEEEGCVVVRGLVGLGEG